MTIAYLRFDLSNEDDKDEHHLMLNAESLRCILWDLREWLLSQIEYKNMSHFQGVVEELNKLQEDKSCWIDDL